MSAMGPGCVKTCTNGECAELFSLFSSFDDDCQSGSFLIQRNRDKLSTCKFDVRVFTQPGSIAVRATSAGLPLSSADRSAGEANWTAAAIAATRVARTIFTARLPNKTVYGGSLPAPQ